ncbi:MAG: acyltransferase [Erythrobacter sp.]|uniref:acyltransferase family protein n=1 Tax=Erythrobacter sp. TaxID=1042 RepID=UPI00262FD59A|nr:acyltransferase [Erythrobacter sp.]MDJ0979835.1 acyltransferase [Erythrobacter sp.]
MNEPTTGQEPPRLSELPVAANGFDTIRLIAACAVIVSHAFPLNALAEPLKWLTGGQASLGKLAVCAFFVISGFLIPASLERGTLARFAEKRARRIMPALIVAVMLCAFALGPVATTMATGAYLSNFGTFKFLANMVFLPVGYDLPGVFEGNPVSAVNGSLWSLKFEVACYILVPILMAFARLRAAAVWAATLGSFLVTHWLQGDTRGALFFVEQMASLFQFYGVGMLFFLYKDRIRVRAGYAWLALLGVALSIPTPFFLQACATLGSYALIAAAYLSPEGFRALTARGDISYGVYVYAFPVQQVFVPFTLGLTIGGVSVGWLANTLFAMPIAALLGAASWWLIEKPALTLGRNRQARPSVA